MAQKGELIAKVKFWFGGEHRIFSNKFIVEYDPNTYFAYIYRKR